jgi:hypothetical protein
VQRAAFETLALALPGSTIGLKWEDDLVACVDGEMCAVPCLAGSAANATEGPGAHPFAWRRRAGLARSG